MWLGISNVGVKGVLNAFHWASNRPVRPTFTYYVGVVEPKNRDEKKDCVLKDSSKET